MITDVLDFKRRGIKLNEGQTGQVVRFIACPAGGHHQVSRYFSPASHLEKQAL